ncbi:hypothetical protein [Sorangium atrum]|uniref:Uncharacterized protein n=1 Tax=Sorangium atrum TaxID=2995308 RepID=A0ABT5C023_9BACT|nr:hypothetical protein [Sorangium aterium]MDC0679707.1 hypothetical protein [Sorangium aterium]
MQLSDGSDNQAAWVCDPRRLVSHLFLRAAAMGYRSRRQAHLQLEQVPHHETNERVDMKIIQTGPLSQNWLHSTEAIVGVFDILGFKQMMVDGHGHLVELAKHVETLARIARSVGTADARFDSFGELGAGPPKLIHVSDTFFMYTAARQPADIVRFLWNAHHLLFYSIIHEFPMRGAIATGELLVNETDRVILGPALLEAHLLEGAQEWAGAGLAPSMSSYLGDIGLRQAIAPLVVPYAVPIKSAHSPRLDCQLALNWLADPMHFLDPEFLSTKFPTTNSESSASSSVSAKIENTRAFAEHALTQGRLLAPSNRRVEFGAPTLDGRPVRFVLDESVLQSPETVPGQEKKG